MLTRLTITALLSVVACWPAIAGPEIDGVTMTMPPPAGFCNLDRSSSIDKSLFDVVAGVVSSGGNRLIAISAKCEELKQFRAGERPGGLDNYAQYQSNRDLEARTFPDAAEAVKQICAVSRRQGQQFMKNLEKDIGRKIEKALPATKVHGTTYIGVLAEDTKACYAALVQKMTTQTGIEKTQVVVLATTVAKGKLVYLMRYAPYEPAKIGDLLAVHRQSVEAFLAVNRN